MHSSNCSVIYAFFFGQFGFDNFIISDRLKYSAPLALGVFCGVLFFGVEPEPDRIVHGEPWIRQLPDPDPSETGSGSGLAGSSSGKSGSRSG